jgi:hypothetical protein
VGLDALEEAGEGYAGPVKLQAAGPWTLAATVERHLGDKAVSDPGATRDLTQSLAEGLRQHVAEVRRRLPGAEVVLQLDEPAVPAVLAGRLPTASGFGVLAAVEAPVVEATLREVLTAAGAIPVVHCCAARPPIDLFRAAGARAVSVDAGLLREADTETLGTAVEAGVSLWLGVVPSTDAAAAAAAGSSGAPLSDLAGSVGPVQRLWRQIGFDPAGLAEAVLVTPTCGLAGASPGYARAALRRCREAGRVLREDPEGAEARG